MGTLRSVKFLFLAPFLVGFLALINVMTWSGRWWVQWAALGIGIAWMAHLFKVIRTVIVAGGVTALGAYILRQRSTRG